MSKINPQIRTINVGVRSLREVTIYPLSLADQFKTTDLVSELVNRILDFHDESKAKEPEAGDINVIKEIVSLVESNLIRILEFVTDPGQKIELNDLTNLQFSELADLIFDVNYSGAVGNFQGLVGKVKKLFLSTRPPQPSSQEPATDTNTSSLKALGPEG